MKGEFHAPELGPEFFPGQTNPSHLWFSDFAGGAFALDRLMLVRLLLVVVVMAFFVVAMRSPKLVPRGAQNVAEIAIDFVRVQIAEEILGGRRRVAGFSRSWPPFSSWSSPGTCRRSSPA